MFDPYHKWLGIPPKDQPPNHYRLLGVDLFESDPDVIDAAANKQMAYLQGCAIGPQVALSQKLLNEVAAARLCLLDPARKAVYDSQLKAQVTPPAQPLEKACEFEKTKAENRKLSNGTWRTQRKKVNTGLVIGILGGVGLLAVVIVGLVVFRNRPEPGTSAGESPGSSKAAPKPGEIITNSLGMEFVLIPQGRSWLGGGGGKVAERGVEISYDFYLGKYEVTQDEWQKVMGSNPSRFQAVPGLSKEDLKRFPVESVSWQDAQEFIDLLNKKLKEPGWVYRLPGRCQYIPNKKVRAC
jgi:formylglycine-generating enzyme required for sulfatase activity